MFLVYVKEVAESKNKNSRFEWSFFLGKLFYSHTSQMEKSN